MAVVIPREGYLQVASMSAKGRDAEIRARGIEAFRADVADLAPDLADRVDALESMDDVKFLDVRLDRLRRWHVDGLLCIGDAAHAMSPIGGVGINLAVQDAVATATLLAGPLLRGGSRRRPRPRAPPPPAADDRGADAPAPHAPGDRDAGPRGTDGGPAADRAAHRRGVPARDGVPAYLIGVGLRPERAPDFARRSPVTAA